MKRIAPNPRRTNYIETQSESSKGRLTVLVIILLFWIGVIGARLVVLQVIHTGWYQAEALKRQRKLIVTDAGRGVIFDRQGRELARTIDAPSFFAVPFDVKDVTALSKQVTAIIGGDGRELTNRLSRAKETNQKFVWVARKVTDEQAEQLRGLAIDGLQYRAEPKRFYPNGPLASHVLGFVSRDNRGLGGVEQFHEKDIAGDEGKMFIDRDAEHRAYASTVSTNSNGDAVTLTIDVTMQYKVEQLLQQAVESNHAKSATAVAMDPRTGEILVLANYPNFDPNDPNGTAAIERVDNALQNIYEPGSTFKLVTYAAALQLGAVHPMDQIDCLGGAITVAGRTIKDSNKYGVLTATEALAKSSNVAAIKLGLKIGNQQMYDFARLFGFGNRTGVELPGESPGILRPVSRWQPSSIGSIAMGQEVGVTPLQITSAFATIANNGVRVAPHVVREIRNEQGEITFRTNAARTQVVSIETAQTLRHMLESVTVSGTAKKAQLDGYSAAGKTGTAQKIDPRTHTYSADKYIASFVGFAPVDDPAIVISVVVDEPAGAHHGGDVAAPVFRDIAEQILPELDVQPDLNGSSPSAKPAAGPDEIQQDEAETRTRNETLPRVEKSSNGGETVYVAAADRSMIMPDLRGRSVRDVAAICAQLGVQIEARGNGRATWQSPAKGQRITIGQVVKVDFSRSD